MTTTADEEQQHLWAILNRLESVKTYEQLTSTRSSAWDVQRGSDLASDDAKTNPYQVSHLARQALTVASDHLHCLRLSLVGDQQGNEITVTMHPYAQATLLRAAFENAARAVWLLGPGKRLTRIQRRLSIQADNNTHSDRMHQLLDQTPKRTTAERMKQLKELAIGAGILQSDVKKQLTFGGFKRMVRTAGDHLTGVGADQAEAVWSACSSLAHGDIHSMSFLDREIVGREGNVALTRLSSDSKVLLWTTTITVQMLEYGFQLYKERATPPA